MPENISNEQIDSQSVSSPLASLLISKLLNEKDANFIEFLRSDVAKEALHQTKDSYAIDQDRKKHWFRMKLFMGYASVIMLISVMITTTWVVLHSIEYPHYVVKSALGALFVDVLGILSYTWKIVFGDN